MTGCPREEEVVAFIRGVGADAGDLRQHLVECRACAEAAEVVAMLAADALALQRSAHVPEPGQVWWRAAVRARMDAVHAASRPLTWSAGVAGAAAAGVSAAALGWAWPSVQRAWALGLALLPPVRMPSPELTPMLEGLLRQALPLVLVISVGLVLAPVVIYLALDE